MSIALLAATVAANVAAVGRADATPAVFPRGGGVIDENVTMVYQELPVAQGDTVRVEREALRGVLARTALPLHFYIVEAGWGEALTRGEVPPHYAHASPEALRDAPIGDRYIEVVRDPTAELQPPAAPEVDGVALVWLMENNATRAAQVASYTDEERQSAFAELYNALPELGAPFGGVVVTAGWLRWAQPAFYAAEALLALAVVASSVRLWRGRRAAPPPVPDDAGDTEALLRLVARAEEYLRNYRNLIVLLGGVLAVGGLVIPATTTLHPRAILRLLAPDALWLDVVGALGWLAYLAIMGAWLVHLVKVQQDLNRWRHRRERGPPPLNPE